MWDKAYNTMQNKDDWVFYKETFFKSLIIFNALTQFPNDLWIIMET